MSPTAFLFLFNLTFFVLNLLLAVFGATPTLRGFHAAIALFNLVATVVLAVELCDSK